MTSWKVGEDCLLSGAVGLQLSLDELDGNELQVGTVNFYLKKG